MPTYQYACTACGHQLEAVQSFTDEPLSDCPSCEGRLRKVFNSVGIVFKGSGFYRTDSRNGEGKIPANGGAAADKPATEKKDAPASGSTGSSGSTSGGTTSNAASSGGSAGTSSASGGSSSGTKASAGAGSTGS
ncbi:FmdB family zinc ribbon protein [Micromonospora sp. NBC_01813]|uniref:FmdB family zinc ribbon protein n=1 Tax=Micromonospora sp. NBC_01813 TaxID=2975988 RepID=UPI002DD7C56B|nr:FmdB family zinc ribbon protein [Micromonospora sp. NBC_01813]WSA06409.1 FmdB family transcriptional regulator [Micromonospora sp. NBC_01813]